MSSQIGLRSIDYSEELGKDLGHLLMEQRRQESAGERDRGLDIFRSGSAPPTVDGSLNAVGGLFGHHSDVWSATSQSPSLNNRQISDEELRSDPAYVNYYYTNVNLNPRLPPPLLSKEDWRFSQRLGGDGRGIAAGGGGGLAVGGIGDRRRVSVEGGGNNELISDFSEEKEGDGDDSRKDRNDWSGNGLIGLPGLGLGSRQKSIADMIQGDLNYSASLTRQSSRPASRNAYDDGLVTSEGHDISSSDILSSKNAGSSASLSYASALGGSVSRSNTPDPQLIARAPSPRIPTAGEGRSSMDKRTMNGPASLSSYPTDAADIVAAMSGMNLSGNFQHEDRGHIKQRPYPNPPESGPFLQQSLSRASKGAHQNNYYSGANSPSSYHGVGSPSSAIPSYSLSGHNNINPALASMMASQLSSGNMPLLYENAPGANLMNAGVDLQNLRQTGNYPGGSGLQVPLVDPLYLQYLRSAEYGASLGDGSMDGVNSYMDLLALQKAYLGNIQPSRKSVGGSSYAKSGGFSPGYYGNQALGFGMGYGGNLLANSLMPNSPVGPGSPMRHGDRSMRLGSGMRGLAAGGMMMDQSYGSSLLDEFKSNKTRCFELSEIAGHVVEFSADQYGSRFIQQKLETASMEEKNMVFHEILPQALSLMTDVFGNYVIQKFFEHGTAPQTRELASKLTGHVLTLSLQMYGCRVIQKAIEVVDLDQQKKMVTELDGHIMRCVRDQNGNHVIQKCIECIPEDAIHFIISTFYDQVVTLSTHPYGCRVIQRVLEHCHDPKTQQIVMDEIMQSICMLAQDQYGNYVVQHVMEHGKPEERSAIISKLTGKIVQMSQQKFASNVIEKCLTFGDPVERRAMVNEMLGSTEDNDPLQAMMKDQFGNYVVQKVLETCDDTQLETILLRIKIHLNALKKYTYGKHIVARVEKLVAAGERRIGMLNPYPAQLA